MKNNILFLAFLSINLISLSQFEKIEKKECYQKSSDRKGKKFVDWECGKVAAIVDCNEKLELDEGSGMVLTASSGSPFSGTCETCHQNGILERRVTFVNGREQGSDTTTYESGCWMVVRNHINGKENGKWSFFYDSTGREAWEMNYYAGEKHGKQLFYNRRGDTTLFENYLNGVLHGVKKTYFKDSGKVEKVAMYTKGLLNGPYLVYNKQGKLIQKLNYKEGKKDGTFTYYYDDGTLLRTENWSMDAKNGEFKTFYYQGNLQTLESWKKGDNKEEAYFSFDVYECTSMDEAKKIAEKLSAKIPSKKIMTDYENSSDVKLIEERLIDQNDRTYLKGQKLIRGVNEIYKYKDKYYVVLGIDRQVIVKREYKEGWFEERFPDQKMKRQALYKKDVLIEEHVFNESGKEIHTFGGTSSKGNEDDELPSNKKKGKKK